jgi:hypothetical protein
MTRTWATGPNEADLEFYGAYQSSPTHQGQIRPSPLPA